MLVNSINGDEEKSGGGVWFMIRLNFQFFLVSEVIKFVVRASENVSIKKQSICCIIYVQLPISSFML